MEPIINRVEESDILLFNLEDLWDEGPVVELDLEPFLYEGIIVREKDFREKVKLHDWTQYDDRHVAVYCSTDAIIPTWAFMLVTSKLEGTARSVAFGRKEDLIRDHFVRALEQVDWSAYRNRPVVIKGCGSKLVPTNAYLLAVGKLQQVAGKLMYGEPCSSVPIWRRPAERVERAAGTKKPAIPFNRID
jgi:hypothetical protein